MFILEIQMAAVWTLVTFFSYLNFLKMAAPAVAINILKVKPSKF